MLDTTVAADSPPARRPARWLMPSSEAPDSVINDWGLHPVTARVLWSRGYRDREAARKFLNPSLADLHDPLRMRGMLQAVERIRRAISARETVLIYGDYDVDGTTSIV